MRANVAAGLAVAGAVTTGCYAYRPVSPEAVTLQADIRARLTEAQARELAAVLPNGDRVIEARVLEQQSDGFLLLVPVVTELRGARVETMHQRVMVPRSGLVEVEVRELDRVRTGVAIAAGAVVVGGVIAAIADRAVNPGSGGGGPGGTDFRAIIVRVPLRR
jgi:hypothetical protein